MNQSRFVALFCIGLLLHSNIQTQETPDQASQQDAVLLVTELSEHLADLIIHHKSHVKDPEKTKEHSIKIVKKMTEIIAECIQKIKTRKTVKSLTMYDETSMKELLEKITLEIVQRVEASDL